MSEIMLPQPLSSQGSGAAAAAKLRPDRAAAVFVWGVWAFMLLVALVLVRWYGSRDVPFHDDWAIVEIRAAGDWWSFGNLWEQYNDHRLPLPKLILLELHQLTGGDFRAGMFFNVAAMGILALAMILAARRLRGSTDYADAVFPLLILSLAQNYTFTLNFTINFVLATVFAGGVLLTMIRKSTQLTVGTVVLAGTCLVLLPLCGSVGLLYVPGLALWLGSEGIRYWFSAGPRRKLISGLALAFPVAGLVLTGCYFIGFERVAQPSLNPRDTVKASVALLSMVVGWKLAQVWWLWAGLGLGILLAASVAGLALTWWKEPAERPQLKGLFLFLGSFLVLTLSIGWGRSGNPLEIPVAYTHYCTLLIPPLCCIYFIWERFPQEAIGRLVKMALAFLLCAVTLTNIQNGLDTEQERSDRAKAFAEDLQNGMPAICLAENYAAEIYTIGIDEFARDMLDLKQRGARLFRQMKDVPPAQPIRADSIPEGSIEGVDDAGRVCGWAWDKKHPNHPIKVDFYEGKTRLGTVTAACFRPDLLRKGVGDGMHGFIYPIPGELWDGRSHTIRARISGADKPCTGLSEVTFSRR